MGTSPLSDVLPRDYARAWLADRDLSPSTRLLYQHTLGKQILPVFGDTLVASITPVAVREWHAELRTQTGPTQRAHAYSLLRTILNTAVADDLIPANPCRVRGAGASKRVRAVRPATVAELEAITGAMPGRYRLMVQLAAWCALRFGELAELRRVDLDVKAGLVHVRRGVVQTATGLLAAMAASCINPLLQRASAGVLILLPTRRAPNSTRHFEVRGLNECGLPTWKPASGSPRHAHIRAARCHS